MRKGLRLVFGVLTAPPEVRAIFAEAKQRMEAAAAKLDAEDPNWRARKFDGPDGILGLSHFLREVAIERDQVETVRAWAKTLWLDDDPVDEIPTPRNDDA